MRGSRRRQVITAVRASTTTSCNTSSASSPSTSNYSPNNKGTKLQLHNLNARTQSLHGPGAGANGQHKERKKGRGISHRCVTLFPTLLAALVYLNTLQAGFVYDDQWVYIYIYSIYKHQLFISFRMETFYWK